MHWKSKSIPTAKDPDGWEEWFAWYPVQIPPHKYWMQKVYRRRVCWNPEEHPLHFRIGSMNVGGVEMCWEYKADLFDLLKNDSTNQG